jgi:quercetin dioxygenase-like cupin family protein
MPGHEPQSQPVAAVRSLQSLLQYQESAVVSRVLLKNSGGTVTLFAFSQGEGLSEHSTPYDALVIGVDGEAEIQISGQSFRLQAGETLTMPASRPHAVHATSDFKMLLVMLRA